MTKARHVLRFDGWKRCSGYPYTESCGVSLRYEGGLMLRLDSVDRVAIDEAIFDALCLALINCGWRTLYIAKPGQDRKTNPAGVHDRYWWCPDCVKRIGTDGGNPWSGRSERRGIQGNPRERRLWPATPIEYQDATSRWARAEELQDGPGAWIARLVSHEAGAESAYLITYPVPASDSEDVILMVRHANSLDQAADILRESEGTTPVYTGDMTWPMALMVAAVGRNVFSVGWTPRNDGSFHFTELGVTVMPPELRHETGTYEETEAVRQAWHVLTDDHDTDAAAKAKRALDDGIPWLTNLDTEIRCTCVVELLDALTAGMAAWGEIGDYARFGTALANWRAQADPEPHARLNAAIANS